MADFPHPPPLPPQPQVVIAPPSPAGNGLGTAGFVVGLLGLIFSFVPVIGIIAWPLTIVGVSLSSVGLSRGRRNNAPTGLAVAGIVCSVIGLTICFLWLLALAA